jgi:hypothetical protein
MVVLNHGCEDFLPIRFPQSGDVGFEIVQGEPHIADHASPNIAQTRPVFCNRVDVGRYVTVRVLSHRRW